MTEKNDALTDFRYWRNLATDPAEISYLDKCIASIENALNRNAIARPGREKTSVWRGVSFVPRHNPRNPYVVRIRARGHTRHIGYYATAEEAAWAYDMAYWKAHRRIPSTLNFPDRLRALHGTVADQDDGLARGYEK